MVLLGRNTILNAISTLLSLSVVVLFLIVGIFNGKWTRNFASLFLHFKRSFSFLLFAVCPLRSRHIKLEPKKCHARIGWILCIRCGWCSARHRPYSIHISCIRSNGNESVGDLFWAIVSLVRAESQENTAFWPNHRTIHIPHQYHSMLVLHWYGIGFDHRSTHS